MSDLQVKIWDTLCCFDGEEVARIFTEYYGNQLLSRDLWQFMKDEGYVYEDDEDTENEEDDYI